MQTLFSAHQAAESAPALSRLVALAGKSHQRLRCIENLIPEALRNTVQAGPIDETHWCLLVQGNASAAKIRQLLPLLQKRLQQQGYPAATIRLKVLPAKSRN